MTEHRASLTTPSAIAHAKILAILAIVQTCGHDLQLFLAQLGQIIVSCYTGYFVQETAASNS